MWMLPPRREGGGGRPPLLVQSLCHPDVVTALFTRLMPPPLPDLPPPSVESRRGLCLAASFHSEDHKYRNRVTRICRVFLFCRACRSTLDRTANTENSIDSASIQTHSGLGRALCRTNPCPSGPPGGLLLLLLLSPFSPATITLPGSPLARWQRPQPSRPAFPSARLGVLVFGQMNMAATVGPEAAAAARSPRSSPCSSPRSSPRSSPHRTLVAASQ
jgi:hypothetical protein